VFKTDVQLTGKWKHLRWLWDADRVAKALDVNLAQATKVNAMLVVREVRQRIRSKQYAPNADLTTAIKRSSTPLIDQGDLWRAVTYQMVNPRTALAGIMRQQKTKAGGEMLNLAIALHEGFTVKVTPGTRGLFYALARYTQGTASIDSLTGRAREIAERLKKGTTIYPLKPTTTAITVPARPFLREVIEDDALREKARKNWQAAMGKALHGK